MTVPPGPTIIPASQPEPWIPLPGSPGEGPKEEAARVVKNTEILGEQLVINGTALVNRRGTNNPLLDEERMVFLNMERKWRLALVYSMNIFAEKSRNEAVRALDQLIKDQSRPGPQL